MISFLPDLNVWLALSNTGHRHNTEAGNWLNQLPKDARLIFSRYHAYRLAAPAHEPVRDGPADASEPRGLEPAFREAAAPFGGRAASKWVGDCYLLAYAKQSQAALVTFDKALVDLARKQGNSAVIPG